MQATNISVDGLWIEVNNIGFVSNKDWVRYPKGRIKKGEILIEVKGQAEKVTIVQEYIPERTLVTGTLFKLSLKPNTVSHEFLFAYFSSKYGKILRDRTKVNTLIAYVSKPELYRIPVPIPSKEINEKITEIVQKAFRLQKESQTLYQQATALLEQELGLDKISFDKPKSYTAKFSEVVVNKRIDSDFYNPDYEKLQAHLKTLNHAKLKSISTLKSGFAFSSKKYKTFGKQIVRIQNISGDRINLKRNPIYYSESDLKGLNHFRINKGDTLMAMTGNTIGNCSLNTTDEELYLNQRVLAVSPDLSQVSAEYLNLILRNVVFKTFIERELVGGAQPNISLEFISNQIIPIVGTDRMKQISDLMKEHYTCIDTSNQLLQEAKNRVEQLIEAAANQ